MVPERALHGSGATWVLFGQLCLGHYRSLVYTQEEPDIAPTKWERVKRRVGVYERVGEASSC